MTENHEVFMDRCFQLAKQGEGFVSPNPMVGAVLVHQNKIISEGYHQKFGEAHAEVNCLHSCPEAYREYMAASTLYVSLEPCSHYGKTGPCSHLIVEKGIRKVVIGSRDFNPKVNGEGIAFLKDNRVEVIDLHRLKQQKELNPQFYVNQVYQRPYIIAKYAQSSDGFMSKKNEEVKITPLSVDVLSHKTRSQVDAILIGKNTFQIDRPSLNTRWVEGKNPDRIVLDTNLENDYSCWASDPQNTIILNQKQEQISQSLHYTKLNDCKNMAEILNVLYLKGYLAILIEGGSQVLQSFMDANIVDQLIIYTHQNIKINEGVVSPYWDDTKFKVIKKQTVESIEIHILQSCNI